MYFSRNTISDESLDHFGTPRVILTAGAIADVLGIFLRCALFPGVYSARLHLLISIDPVVEGFDGGPLYFRVADRANYVSAS